MSFVNTLITFLAGNPNKRVLKDLESQVEIVNSLEEKYAKLSDSDLREMTVTFQSDFRGISGDSMATEKEMERILPHAFAVVREAGKRVLSQRPYDVQVMGALAIHQGKIAEMKTGEGKTLTSTMAIYLNALAGRGVHVVTVNDYLARRDASWMGQIFHFLGLTISCIQGQNIAYRYDATIQEDVESEGDDERAFKVDVAHLIPCSRKSAYAADITYGINSEFGFDYLRDNMVLSESDMAQRGLNFAIIDEVDSILIDEARTPLIISSPDSSSSEHYKRFASLMPLLKEQEDYLVDEKRHASTLTEKGIKKMEEFLGVDNIYTEDVVLAHHIEQALKAHTLYKRDREYTVKDGEIIIVDEFTGRLMPGRRYSQGLHQAIEAKERVEVQQESRTLATITIQNYFRMYRKIAGMTGTAATEAEEFHKIYNLDVVEIPTNKPMIRIDYSDVIYKTEKAKLNAVAMEIKQLQEKGQPALVGTVSIEKNEKLAELLSRQGVVYQLLNAKHHEREAEIIAQAGRKGSVTIATNMAGRGVDIILGGAPFQKELYEEVKMLGGLAVLGTERHESRRIDNQLRGRSGRQGDSGYSRFFISLEDDLMRVFGSERLKNMMDRLGLPDDMPITNQFISKSIESAQKKVEGHNFDLRKHLVEYDDVVNKQREIMYKQRSALLSVDESDNKNSAKKQLTRMIEEEVLDILAIYAPSANVEDAMRVKENMKALFSVPIERFDFFDSALSIEESKRNGFLFQKIQEMIKARCAELEDACGGADQFQNIARMMILRVFDMLWMDHIDTLDHIRTGIGLQGYGQRDPLVEYKRSAFLAYDELKKTMRSKAIASIFKLGDAMAFVRKHDHDNDGSAQSEGEGAVSKKPSLQTSSIMRPRDTKKIGRNELCHCGSGKKFKRCHGG